MGCFLFSGIFWLKGKWDKGLIPQITLPTTEITIRPTQRPAVKPNIEEKQLIEALKNITATTSGKYAVGVYHPDDGSSYGYNQDQIMPAASMMKLPVFLAVLDKIEKGDLRFEDKYTLEEADRAAGSGPLQFKPAGSTYTIDQLLTYLGKNSDNTAWVMFNRRLGMSSMEEMMKTAGMTASSYQELTTTVEDQTGIWKYIYNSDFGRKEMTGYLTGSIYEDRIPAGITNPGAEIMHKVGTDAGVWADGGIISCQLSVVSCQLKPFILVILNDGVKRAEAEGIVPEIARKVWEFELQRDQ